MSASSLTDPITYNIPGNFTFDSDFIDFPSGGPAKLKLQEDQETFSQDFSSDSGFTYDNTLAEFASGVVRTIDKTPAGSVLAGLFDSKDLNWRKDGGSLTGTLNGSPTFSGGKMVCTGSQGVSYTRTTSAIESWYIEYTPNYTGAPPVNVNILGCVGTNNDRLGFTHSPSGDNLRINLFDSSGVNLISTASIGASAINLQAGTKYYFFVVADSTAGTIRVYRKPGGSWSLFGTLTPGAWLRGGVSKTYAVGANTSVYNRAEASFDNFVVFSTAVDPTSSDPTTSIPSTIYLESKVDLPVFTFGGLGSIVSVDSATVTETDEPRYIIAGRYWNGSSWVTSDGTFAQASPSATVLANLTSFPATGATLVPVSVVFGSKNVLQAVDGFSVTVTGTTDYPTGVHKIVKNSSVESDDFEGIEIPSGGVVTPTDTSVLYTINVNGVEKFFNTSTGEVETSDGTLAQLNTLDELNDNKDAFDWALGVNAKLTAWLRTTDTTKTPEVEQLNFLYNFFQSQDAPQTCTVWFNYLDIGANPIEDATVKVSLLRSPSTQYKEAAGNVIEAPLSKLTDANGRVEFDLIRSSEYEGSGRYVLEIIKTSADLETSYTEIPDKKLIFLVPDQSGLNLTSRLRGA